jgi:hypothetical protein
MVQGDDESFSVLREKRFKGKMMKGFHVIREKTIYKRNSFAAKGLDMEGMYESQQTQYGEEDKRGFVPLQQTGILIFNI